MKIYMIHDFGSFISLLVALSCHMCSILDGSKYWPSQVLPDVALISPLPSYFLSSSNNFTQISRCTLKSEVLDIIITENTKSGMIFFVFLVHPYGSEKFKNWMRNFCGTSA